MVYVDMPSLYNARGQLTILIFVTNFLYNIKYHLKIREIKVRYIVTVSRH